MPCAPGTVWSQRQQTCVAENQLKEMERGAVEVEEEESDMCKPRNPNSENYDFIILQRNG